MRCCYPKAIPVFSPQTVGFEFKDKSAEKLATNKNFVFSFPL